jgi:hypothetical protein
LDFDFFAIWFVRLALFGILLVFDPAGRIDTFRRWNPKVG